MQENNIVLFEQYALESFKTLSELKKEQKRLEEIDKKVRTEIEKAMNEYDIQSFKNDYVTISRVAQSTTRTIDVKKLQEREPQLYDELIADYPKTTLRKASIRIEVK